MRRVGKSEQIPTHPFPAKKSTLYDAERSAPGKQSSGRTRNYILVSGVPERHKGSRALVDGQLLEGALGEVPRVPDVNLTFACPGEASRDDPVEAAQPSNAGALTARDKTNYVRIGSHDCGGLEGRAYMPVCESATVTAAAPARGSKSRSFLSLQVLFRV